MYTIEVHSTIGRSFELLQRMGLCQRGNEATNTESINKFFYSIYFLLFPISLLAGAITNDDTDESILLAITFVITLVHAQKLFKLIWRKNEIVEYLHRVCVVSTDDREEFTDINDKLNSLIQVVAAFFSFGSFCCINVLIVIPFIGNERTLFYKVGFPLDWRHNEFAFWLAFVFTMTEVILSLITVFFSFIMWYLLLKCGFMYKSLGTQFRNMGKIKVVDAAEDMNNLFLRDLISGIKRHQRIKESIGQLESFLSDVLSAQLATGSVNICASIYCLKFNSNNVSDAIVFTWYLTFSIFDIFTMMYFANEIRMYSDRLSYCLFESDWVNQSQSCKKAVLIFGELLRQPQLFLILKIYPLTLEMFIRIINSAYSMFNILKNVT